MPTVSRKNKKLSNTPTIALKTKKQRAYTFRKYAANPKDRMKRKVWFWVLAVLTPILFYVYNLA